MTRRNNITKLFAMVAFIMVFSISFIAQTAYADEIDFSKYTSTYGYENLATFDDGDDRQAVYDGIYDAYEGLWSNTEDLTTEYVADSGFYAIAQLDVSAYNLDTDDLLEIYMAFQFDNPIFYYAPTSFYPPSESSQTMTLVIDEDYINASERTRLNALVISKVSEYETAVASLTTDYDKMVAVHDKLLNSMYYSYDDEGNPSDEAWAHNVVGSFDKGEGVCESYAKAYQIVMNALGYDSIMVAGISNGEGHVWNLVNLDGDYYYIDCTWDDTLNGIRYSYFLKGSYEFAFDHTNYTTSGSGQTYQYALPNVCEDNYIKYLTVSCDGGAVINYGNVKLAFDSMTDTEGSYVITVEKGYDLYLQSGEWPVVKEIRIIGYDHYDANNMYYSDGVYLLDDVNANSDIVIENMNISTARICIETKNKLATLNLGNNSIKFKNAGYIGGYTIVGKDGVSTDYTGVNIVGDTGSQLIADEYRNSSFLSARTELIDVDEIIVSSSINTVCNEIRANKLIFGDGYWTFEVMSDIAERPAAIVDVKETVVNEGIGCIKANDTYADTTVSLGNVTGSGRLFISVTCTKADAYPNITIDNSEVELMYNLYNMKTSGILGESGMLEDKTYTVWDEAINYNDGFFNMGSTDIDKVYDVSMHLFRSNNGEEPIEVLQTDNIALLCDVDENGNLYRAYNEKMMISDDSLLKYVVYQESEATQITIPKGIYSIGANAFKGCKSIESVTIPEGVVHIYDNAFAGCSLIEVSLPSTLDSIGNYAFGYDYDSETDTYTAVANFRIYGYNKYCVMNYAETNNFAHEYTLLPATVQNIEVASKTGSSVTITWDAVSGADGYFISFHDGDKWAMNCAGVSGGTNTRYTVSGLDALKDYSIGVTAYMLNSEGEKILGNDMNVLGVILAPAVTGFSYSARTTDSITFKWNKVSGVEGYVIEQYYDGQWNLAGMIEGEDNTSARISYLDVGTAYKFRVCSYVYNSQWNYEYGPYSERTVSTVLPGVTGFTYSGRTASTVSLKWEENVYADGYEIQQYKNGAWTTIKTISGNSTVSYKITGLSASTAYSFRIRAYNGSGSSKAYSTYSSKSVKTLPGTVTGFTYSGRTASTITLKWNKSASADGYVIQQYKSGKWVTIKTITKNSTLSYKVTGLSPSVTYKFRIRTYKADGSSKLYGAYTTKSVKTLPSTVKNFTYSGRTASTVTLKWSKNTSADGYVIQQYKGGKWVTIKTITKNSTLSYKVTGLSPSKTYKFRIRVYKNDGSTKLYSTSYTTKSVQTLPSTVKGFTYKTRTKTTITLKWTKNTSADGYVIQQYKGGKWVTIKTVTKNSTVSHKVTGLKKATTYKFRIRTYKKSGSTKLYASYTTKSIKTLS